MADKRLHVLYVPGLGDDAVTGQRVAVRTWRLWGVDAEVAQVHWADHEPWEAKRDRLLDRIDNLLAQNIPVALVGSSAGASAVINLFSLRAAQITGCVLIAGKVNHVAAIGSEYRMKNPSFVQSARSCEKALASLSAENRMRILSRYGIVDEIVPKKDSYIEGSRNQMVLTVGHAVTIGTQIIFGAPAFLRFLKNLARKRPAA